MDFIFNFLSSIFLGLGAALLLAAAGAVLFVKAFGLDYLRTGLLALFLLIFGGYQMVLLVGASSVRGLVDQAATAAEITTEAISDNVDAADLLEDIPGASAFLSDETAASVGTVAAIARRIDESIGDYMLRRALWLAAFCAAALGLAALMRPRRPAPMPSYGDPSGSSPSGGGYDLNF